MPIPRLQTFKITVVHQDDGKFLASVLEQTGYDQRDGASYRTLGSALGSVRDDVIYDAVQEAFFP